MECPLRHRIVIFGCGSSGDRAHEQLREHFTVVAFSDNNTRLHDTKFHERPVVAPAKIATLDFDRIVIASMYYQEIRDQLLHQLGIEATRIAIAPEFQRSTTPRERLRPGTFGAFLRRTVARYRYHDYWGLGRFGLPRPLLREGYQRRLSRLKNRHFGRPLFLIAAGRSIKSIDPRSLAQCVTITCNGAYRFLNDAGVASTYFVIEDRRELERRRAEWDGILADTKLTSLENADLVRARRDTLFFQTNRHPCDAYFWDDEPRPFSRDFAIVAYLGGTITYVMLQLAYHLGGDPVILLGIDHTYGKLIKELGVKVSRLNRSFLVTPENHHIFSRYHFGDSYFKIGERINLPSLEEQEHAFRQAAAVFSAKRIRVINGNPGSGLDMFEKKPFEEVMREFGP